MKTPIVVDVSVSAAWVLPDERNDLAEAVLRRVLSEELHLILPDIWQLETINVLRNAVTRKRLDADEVGYALDIVDSLPITFAPCLAEDRRTLMRLTLEHGLTPYDAAYLHLAQTRRVDLLSADSDLLRLRARFPWIRALEDFCAPA